MENSNFKFLGYKINKFSVEISDNFVIKPEKLNNKLDIQNNFSKDNKRFVEVVLNIDVTNEAKTLQISLQIKGGFESENELPEDLFKQLILSNAPAILYPFARALITSCTSQFNIPPIILPIVNFSKTLSSQQ